MDLVQRVKRLLRRRFAPADIKLDDDDGVTGYIVSPMLRGKSSLERQTEIDEVLRDASARLSQEDLSRILLIAALTPVEFESASTH
jgi:hypothetical protein